MAAAPGSGSLLLKKRQCRSSGLLKRLLGDLSLRRAYGKVRDKSPQPPEPLVSSGLSSVVSTGRAPPVMTRGDEQLGELSGSFCQQQNGGPAAAPPPPARRPRLVPLRSQVAREETRRNRSAASELNLGTLRPWTAGATHRAAKIAHESLLKLSRAPG